MANKKKIFDRLENLNISNNYKNEIFNLIEDIEKENKINVGEGLKYNGDKLVVSLGTAIAAAGGNDRSGLILRSSEREKIDYVAINVGDGLEIDKYNKLNVTGGKISEVINEEIYYNDGSGQLVPMKHPDLSTQPSILPYKFMGQYVYEQLIHVNKTLSEINNATFTINADEFNDTNIFLQPNVGVLEANLVLFTRHDSGEGFPKPAAIRYMSVDLESYEIYGEVNRIVVSSGSFDDTRLSLVGAWLRIVYTTMPEEEDYYGYNNY